MTEEGITLKEYFEKILEERDKALVAALAAAKEAVSKAEANAEQWRAGANEWRGAMNDRETKFMTIQDKESIEKDLKELRTFKDTMSGKADQKSVTNAMIFSILAVALGLISLALNIINTVR